MGCSRLATSPVAIPGSTRLVVGSVATGARTGPAVRRAAAGTGRSRSAVAVPPRSSDDCTVPSRRRASHGNWCFPWAGTRGNSRSPTSHGNASPRARSPPRDGEPHGCQTPAVGGHQPGAPAPRREERHDHHPERAGEGRGHRDRGRPDGPAQTGLGDADGTDGGDADGTDGDSSDGDSTDGTDGDSSDGGDADGTDA